MVYEDKVHRTQRLVKTTGDHLVQINYNLKPRRHKPVPPRNYEEEHEAQMNHMMKFMPLMHVRQPQFKEETKPLVESGREPLEGKVDPKEDFTSYEIIIIDRNNEGVKFTCHCHHQEIIINGIIYLKDAQKHSSPEIEILGGEDLYHCIFDQLSTRLQKRFIEYLYSMGVPPDIGLIVEFMSINKEQRMYMNWLKVLQDIDKL